MEEVRGGNLRREEEMVVENRRKKSECDEVAERGKVVEDKINSIGGTWLRKRQGD